MLRNKRENKMIKHILKHFIPIVIVIIILDLFVAEVFADELKDSKGAFIPKIEVNEGNWLVISYSEKIKDKNLVLQELKAYLSSTLKKMNSPHMTITESILGSRYMEDTKMQNTHGSYVQAWFGTHGSWDTSDASFYGSSVSYWAGWDPFNLESVARIHFLDGGGDYGGIITGVPSGWYNNFGYWATSPPIYIMNSYILMTAWSGLTATWTQGHPAILIQCDTASFDFPSGEDPVLNPQSNLYYGD